MDNTSFGKAALHKFGTVPEGFHIFYGEWLGNTPDKWKSMRVKGAVFIGKLRAPNTTMETIVTKKEMARYL
ncbi:hypothetical protein [Methylomonas sp. 11b]|uniref:hypothetical protein n=1 Tax=Methylomonas sp. 11b TaxID=1168169 RepID=UPI0012DC31DB|nr:hypothetical protein [Methylomonas sp. 11b]